MFLRILSTAASLVVAAVAVTAIDCASTTLRVVDGDPIGMCAAVDELGSGPGLWVGIGLAVFSAISLMATWVPAARPGARRRRLQPESSLNRNLGRLADVSAEPEDEPASDIHVRRVSKRLEAIESSLASETTPAREVTEQWMILLRDVNALHNSGELPTEDFKTLNTRLVELFAGPTKSQGEMAASR